MGTSQRAYLWLGGGIVLMVTIAAIFAPFLATHNPYEPDLDSIFAAPSLTHFFWYRLLRPRCFF